MEWAPDEVDTWRPSPAAPVKPLAAYPWLDSCPASVPSSAWESRPLPEDLAQLTDDMVGRWRGVVTTPWIAPYPVAMEFSANGQYSAKALIGDHERALYYGTDDDSPLKQWRLEDMSTLGVARGEIDVIFHYPETGFYEAAWQGELRDVEMDASGNRLVFAFSRSDGYGPVVYDLARCR